MNIQKLMRQAQEMQEKMQRDLANVEFTASVGGGMVEVRMNGEKEVLAVKIDPEVLDPTDPAMVQDLVLAAVNEAGRKVNEHVGQQIGNLTAGIPGLG